MHTITTILLVIWIILVADSTCALICKFSKSCLNFAHRFSLGRWKLSNFALNNWWPYVYLFMALMGLLTVLVVSNKEAEDPCKRCEEL